jgi:hypothetical protein
MTSGINAHWRGVLLLITMLAPSGCDSTTSPITGDFRGIYVAGWEASGFRGCMHPETWWMSGNLAPIFDVAPRNPQTLETAAYVRVRGTRSERGAHGHLGSYPYELVVSEVLDVSADTPGACRR